MDLDDVEVRVLGCLIEKQRTTPDAYPLSLNALRLACNQSTNRDPVVDYDERTIRDALQKLGRRRFTRLASGHGSRAIKYRHLLDDELRLDGAEQSVLAVLMLRGPQTPGELRQRSERLHPFPDAASLEGALERLIARDLVVRLARRPGQKEERYAHRLSEDLDEPAPVAPAPVHAAQPSLPVAAEPAERSFAVVTPAPAAGAGSSARLDDLERRVEALEAPGDDRHVELERRVEALAAQVAELRRELGLE